MMMFTFASPLHLTEVHILAMNSAQVAPTCSDSLGIGDQIHCNTQEVSKHLRQFGKLPDNSQGLMAFWHLFLFQ